MEDFEKPHARSASGVPASPLETLLSPADAVVFSGDHQVRVEALPLREPSDHDVIVETELTGISTGTEKLFWSGAMPPFPGMGYPLVPGYETVGRVVWAAPGSPLLGQRVFVGGAHSFEGVHCLFGGAAAKLIAPVDRVFPLGDLAPEPGLLLSLAATAYHAMVEGTPPDLIVGFGVLGRLLYRLTRALGHPSPQVWEIHPARQEGEGIHATTAADDTEARYHSVYDVSGSTSVIDSLIRSLGHGGTITLAGFYPGRVDFPFAPAFQKEARFRIAAEWSPADLQAVLALLRAGQLSLDGLITHSEPVSRAANAYRTAFEDARCLKMMINWREARG